MFENINNNSLKSKESNTIKRDTIIKKILEKEKEMGVRFRRKVQKISRMMVAISAISLGAGTIGAGIYGMYHVIDNYVQKENEIHKGTGIIVEKTYYKAVNEGFDTPYYSITINMNGKILEGQIKESIFNNVTEGKNISFTFHSRGSIIIPELGVKSGPEAIIDSLKEQNP